MERFTFRKQERLSSQILINKLFSKGKSFYFPPFRLVYLECNHDSEFPLQILFSVPKKRFKRAVKRNLIRRRLKEIYRLKKPVLYQRLKKSEKKYILTLIYSSNKVYSSHYLAERFNLLIEEWYKQI